MGRDVGEVRKVHEQESLSNDNKGQIVLFQTEDGQTEVQLQDETVWLTIGLNKRCAPFSDSVVTCPYFF